MGNHKKTQIEKIADDVKVTREVLENFSNITSEEMKYAKASQDMFFEENEAFYYVTVVFQNNACAAEFCENFKEFLDLKSDEQMFVDGHELAKKWGKPIQTPYVKKTVNLDRLRDANSIADVGVYNGN